MPSSPWQVVKSATKFVRSLLFSSSTRWLGNRIVKWNLDKFEIEKNVTFLIQKKISLKIEKMCTLLPSLLWKNNEWIQLPIETFLNWQFNWVELQFNKFQWVYCSNSSMMCLKAKKNPFATGHHITQFSTCDINCVNLVIEFLPTVFEIM